MERLILWLNNRTSGVRRAVERVKMDRENMKHVMNYLADFKENKGLPMRNTTVRCIY